MSLKSRLIFLAHCSWHGYTTPYHITGNRLISSPYHNYCTSTKSLFTHTSRVQQLPFDLNHSTQSPSQPQYTISISNSLGAAAETAGQHALLFTGYCRYTGFCRYSRIFAKILQVCSSCKQEKYHEQVSHVVSKLDG